METIKLLGLGATISVAILCSLYASSTAFAGRDKSRTPFAEIDKFCADAIQNASAVATKTRLYFFTSDSCGPCRSVEPVVKKLQKQYSELVRVDANSENGREFARRYRLTATPTFVVVSVDVATDKETFVERWTGGYDAERKIASSFDESKKQ